MNIKIKKLPPPPQPIHKFNGGAGATLCNSCRVIIHTGLTDDLYCPTCLKRKESE